MNIWTPERTGKYAFFVLLLSIVLAACATGPAITEDVEARYQEAIRVAELPDEDAIVTTLVAITPDNEELIWKEAPGDSPVLVVNWTDAPPEEASGDSLVTQDEIWVTVAPELQRFCRSSGLAGERLIMRLRQVLGLPPDAPYTHFVAYWVSVDDLFRPCPDPQVTDRDCELDFPKPSRLIYIDPDHQMWFNDLRETTYGQDGYPWTRLGYTYDWGNPDDPVGFSEFIITPGSGVEIEEITDTAAYCGHEPESLRD